MGNCMNCLQSKSVESFDSTDSTKLTNSNNLTDSTKLSNSVEIQDLSSFNYGLEIPPKPPSNNGDKSYNLEPNVFYTRDNAIADIKSEANKLLEKITELLEIMEVYQENDNTSTRISRMFTPIRFAFQTDQTDQITRLNKWCNVYICRRNHQHVKFGLSIYFDYKYYEETNLVRFIIELRRTETRGNDALMDFVSNFRLKLIENLLIKVQPKSAINAKWKKSWTTIKQNGTSVFKDRIKSQAEIDGEAYRAILEAAPKLCLTIRNFAAITIQIEGISSKATVAELKQRISDNRSKLVMPNAMPRLIKLAIMSSEDLVQNTAEKDDKVVQDEKIDNHDEKIDDSVVQTKQTKQTEQTEQTESSGFIVLVDANTLESYNIKNNMTIHITLNIEPSLELQESPLNNLSIIVRDAISHAKLSINDDWNNNFGILLKCSTDLNLHQELLSQDVIELLRRTFFSQSMLERSNNELFCCLLNILTNLLMNPDPDIAHQVCERARDNLLYSHLLLLILSTSNPFVLIDASRTLLAFGSEFFNMLVIQDENIRFLLIRVLDVYKNHPKQIIQNIWLELSTYFS